MDASASKNVSKLSAIRLATSHDIPIMGKTWPQGGIAYHESTTALSNIVAISESPRWEDLLVVGTDDGLVQVTEDGGRNWRKIEDFPACRSGRT